MVIFATLGFMSVYSHIHRREEDIKKLAFACPKGIFEFNQRALDLLKLGLTWEEVLTYLDNFIVFALTFDVFLQWLEKLFQHQVMANHMLKLSKCFFRYH